MTRASTKVTMGESTYYATLNQFAVKRITPTMPRPSDKISFVQTVGASVSDKLSI